MNQGVFVGLGLIAVAAYHLLPAVLTRTIPSNWPIKPLSRDAKPEQYRITFGVFAITGLVGLGILLAALARMAGL